jgi:hypothetical protein
MTALLWCRADRVLFSSSNAPFSKEASADMISLLREISEGTVYLWKATEAGLIHINSDVRRNEGGFSLQTWYVAAVLRHISEWHR